MRAGYKLLKKTCMNIKQTLILLQELICSFCFTHLHHSDEKRTFTRVKNFIKITGVAGTGAAKSEREHI